jgi:hypothetical protein
VPPPGEEGTTILTLRVGHACPELVEGSCDSAGAAGNARSRAIAKDLFMPLSVK